MLPIEVVAHDLGRAAAWPALFGLLIITVVLGLLVMATSVALFARDNKRADRARRIVTDLLRLLRGWPR